MDLKDVIAKVQVEAKEAMSASNAGHPETAGDRLFTIKDLLVEYLCMPARPAGDVTESATSEKPAETSKETPENVPGPADQPAGEGPVLPASQFGGSLTDVKPTQ